MELKQIMINNLKAYRQNLGYTQEDLAKYIGVDRSLISHYENGTREITLIHLNKFSDLFGIETDDFLVNNSSEKNANLAFAFRSHGMEKEDLSSVAEFQKIVKNYIKIIKLAKGD
ncbi:MAG: helix-turn-helix transcriptional regulator [Bacteroidales bacterium]|jgi:transcriptional regulator with XRE-family HTH domain|nr:helix-turn-helix transcriptional regulator [Bacteroidales bacterium]